MRLTRSCGLIDSVEPLSYPAVKSQTMCPCLYLSEALMPSLDPNCSLQEFTVSIEELDVCETMIRGLNLWDLRLPSLSANAGGRLTLVSLK